MDEGNKVILVDEDIDLLTLLVSNTTGTCDDIMFIKPAIGNVQTCLHEIQTIQSETPELQ